MRLMVIVMIKFFSEFMILVADKIWDYLLQLCKQVIKKGQNRFLWYGAGIKVFIGLGDPFWSSMFIGSH